MRKRNWDKLYETYKTRYYKKSSKSIVGFEDVYTKTEFKTMYLAMENDRAKEIKLGKRKVLNITQDLVAKQEKYLYTQSQARSIKIAIKQEYDKNLTLKDIRTGKSDLSNFWEIIKQYSQNRKVSDLTVGQMFFGSEV